MTTRITSEYSIAKQALRGRGHESAMGMAANATVFGEDWVIAHLSGWSRLLGRKSSAIGMSTVLHAAER